METSKLQEARLEDQPQPGASHLDVIRKDSEYVDILANWDAAFYSKYTEALIPSSHSDLRRGPVLDVGCGVGQVVRRLLEQNVDAHGVDVAQANIERARQWTDRCHWYDGSRLPFSDGFFQCVGALNVLEHVEDPEGFLKEMVRVTRPGGRIVVSSPNFLRVLGWRDYHPRMRGLKQKWGNLLGLLRRRRAMKRRPDAVQFERMTPIIKTPFTPDDDAIICTNALDIGHALRQAGCQLATVSCTDRHVPRLLNVLLNASPLKYGMFNAFVVATRPVQTQG